MNIKRNQEEIYRLLRDYAYLRDDDAKLICNIWKIQLDKLGIDLDTIDGRAALQYVAGGKLSPAESITRCRRKLQEKHPELRGEKWKARHEAQEEVVDQIINW